MSPLRAHTMSRYMASALLMICCTLSVRADYPSTVLSQGPVGYWQLNETTQPQSGNVATNAGSLGSAANGSYNNFPTLGLPGPFAGSAGVGLDGSATYISSPYSASLNPTSFTIEAWVKPVSATVAGGLLCVASSIHAASPRAGWLIYQTDGTAAGAPGVGWYLRLYAQNTTAFSIQLLAPQTVVPGTWTHLVYTFDGTTAKAYINGALVASGAGSMVANPDANFAIGARSDVAFLWPGQAAEVAYYSSALSGVQITNHYATAILTPASYATTVGLDSPILYYRFKEAGNPPAVNSGTLGSAANGIYISDAVPGVAGPVPPTFPGFAAGNKAVSFDAGGGVVRIPALNLNTNAVTISAWVYAVGSQPIGAPIVICNSGTTDAGLTIDQVFGGHGLGYIWQGKNYGWSPNSDSGLPALPDSTWAYVALVVEPSKATLYICDANNFANFASVNDAGYTPVHVNQAFDGSTLIGAYSGNSSSNFNGTIDEVTIFNRALGAGELYTQYGTAVGGVPPKIFTDLVGPVAPVAVGDPIVLTVDGGGTAPNTFIWHTNGVFFTTTTGGVLTIASAALSNAANYDVIISNSFAPPVQSQTVAVSVVTPVAPVITGSQGFLNRTLYPGGTINLSITATGGGLKYQWFKGGTNIPSATTSALIIPNIVATNAGSYSVSVSNSVNKASNGPVVLSVITPGAGSYEALMVSAAPEAWWRLNEAPGSTNMFDAMGRHDGVYSNMNGSVPPVVLGSAGALATNLDKCATFSPSYKGVGVVPFSIDLNTSPWSIEAWVKTTVLNANLVPVSSSAGASGGSGEWMQSISGWWYGNCSAGYFGNNGNANTAAQVVAGQWTHIVLTYDASRVSGGIHYPNILYVDGQTDGFIWGGPSSLNTGAPFIIGGRGVSPSALADLFMDGQVDEVAVYKRL